MYIDAYRKVAPDTHWDTFEVVYGNPVSTAGGGGVFLVMNLMKSLAETDKSIQTSEQVCGGSRTRRHAEDQRANGRQCGSNRH